MNGLSNQDYYQVLGVGRNASQDDIRRAYRQKARENHPDHNPGDREAEERIKAVNEAYEVLRDPKKRSAYDRFGQAGVKAASGAGAAGYADFGDLGDIFESFFGFGTGRSRGPKGQRAVNGDDRRTKLNLDFEEAVFGATKQVPVQRQELCDVCDGSGAAPGTESVRCSTCSGTGEIRRVQQSVFGAFVNVQTCHECKGRGELPGQPCPQCGGKRRIRRRRNLEVDIPAGVEGGTQIRLSGEGDHGLLGGRPGDLYVVLDVADHAIFQRDGNDLHVEMWLNPADAALGTEIIVPTLEGESTLTVPPATQSGDTLRLEGLGVPYLKRRGRGDEVVTLRVETPEKLTREQRDLMEQLRDTLPEARVARRGEGFWDRVKQKFS